MVVISVPARTSCHVTARVAQPFSCPRLAAWPEFDLLSGMSEADAAAAIEAMSVDDSAEEPKEPDSTVGTVPAAEVLQSINANTGEPLSPNPLSRIPPTARGAHSSHDFAARVTLFWSGRDRR